MEIDKTLDNVLFRGDDLFCVIIIPQVKKLVCYLRITCFNKIKNRYLVGMVISLYCYIDIANIYVILFKQFFICKFIIFRF